MKRSVKRLCSACLLMAIALTASIICISAVSKAEARPAAEKDKPYLWVRLLLKADSSVKEIRLFSHDGLPMQTLQAEKGTALSELIMPGTYFAVTQEGCTEFVLHEDASVSVSSGYGWSDGEQLFLRAGQAGTVHIERLSSAEDLNEQGGWLDYTLSNASQTLHQTIRCTQKDTLLQCIFRGVPYGTYTLEENGERKCTVSVSAEQQEVTLALP